MKIKVKTLDQSQFTVEVNDTDTIREIQSKIQKERNNDPTLDPKISKLIWKGKILKLDQNAKDCNLTEKGFFVIMPGKVPKSSGSSSKTPENTVEDRLKPKSTDTSTSTAKVEKTDATEQISVQKTDMMTDTTDKKDVNNENNKNTASSSTKEAETKLEKTALETAGENINKMEVTSSTPTVSTSTEPQSQDAATVVESTQNTENQGSAGSSGTNPTETGDATLETPVNQTGETTPVNTEPTNSTSNVGEDSNTPSTSSQVQISEEIINNVVELGFDREKVKQALQVTQGNPDIAVELIMSGRLDQVVADMTRRRISNSSQQIENSSSNTASVNTSSNVSLQNISQQSSNVTSPENTQNEGNPLSYLTENATFRQMVNLINTNPEMLPTVLQQIGTHNPELLQQIQNNHHHFLDLLNNASQSGSNSESNLEGGNLEGVDGNAGAEVGSLGSREQTGQQRDRANQPQGQRIELEITQGDRDSIDRLISLGFSELEAVEAYFACDRNELAAANFLFDQ